MSKKKLEQLYDSYKLNDSYKAIHEKEKTLAIDYFKQDFKAAQAREYANHGFCRRLRILAHCIERVFEILPLNAVQSPETYEQKIYEQIDATVYLQAFVFNVFGCVNNLAHIWVREKGLTDKEGRPLPNREVGFGEKNKRVLDSLSSDFRDYLVELKPWFEGLENFRHALAHRIPLYVSPYNVLKDKQHKFVHLATHSFGENAPLICFHDWMINDFDIVEKIAQKLLEEFDR